MYAVLAPLNQAHMLLRFNIVQVDVFCWMSPKRIIDFPHHPTGKLMLTTLIQQFLINSQLPFFFFFASTSALKIEY